ncbi:MAG: alpha/beta hydrolase [Alphaproteobacteria bacterium]|nr:alpha/beta hydrolase [Alphaproteobacteria bacterium]MBU0795545.1 alpha/beta hydrolase [Alphaproteobacteria bacterium]MBU0874652.1 alpha/beta hydrolase [Alphaproteobacteria bacterium]MBU1770060.1 alpha/beta hydrolase [Alphaproteobacteria bacterium]
MATTDGGLDRRGFLAAAGIAVAAAGAVGVPMAVAQPPGMPPRTIPQAWTAAPTIDLWTGAPPESGFAARPLPMEKAPPVFMHNVEKPYLRVFRPARPNGRAVLVIPGGAYIFISIDNEGAEVGQALADRGYTVFVLVHRLPGEGWSNRADVPLQDAQRAMRLIRSMAGTYGIKPEQVSVLGFSAGGHLAATLTTDFGQQVYAPRDSIDRLDARPRTSGLIYPVISMRFPDTHADSRKYLLGETPDPATVSRRSPAAHVGPETPPTFLMHTLDDPAVPPSNSQEMLQALRVAGRPVEAHFFEEGGHGFGLGRPDLPVHQWLGLFAAFLDRHAAAEA